LSAPTYQTVSLTCPNCQHSFAAPVLTIIDVGQHPELKALLLSGQINIAVCSQCGQAGALQVPLVYHDPEKELLLVFAPPKMGMSEIDQQRIIGDLTNQVIAALPSQERKGYLLRPRTFLRLESLLEAILEADGITPEMLEAQQARATLLDQLLRATTEDARRTIVQENDAQIDYEFLHFLSLNMELAQTEGQEEMAQQLGLLRQRLLAWTTVGQEATAREDAIQSLHPDVTREELLEKIVEAALSGEKVKVEALVAVARPAIDYAFYQQLSARIEAAEHAGDTEEAQTLKELRDTILNLTAQLDAELQQAAAQAKQVIGQIMGSDDLEQAIRANIEHVDELFLSVLATNLQAAQQSDRSDDVAKLEQIAATIMKLIDESQPPEIQFINQLVMADYPEGTQALLDENREQVNAALLELMDVIGKDLVERGQKETARRLAQIRAQAAATEE